MTDPIAPNLIDPAGHQLIGGRHKQSDRIVFPFPSGPEAAEYEKLPLAGEGTLWSFTVQRFRPKSPPYAGADDERSFKPFALGYVELPGQIIVETRIKIDDFARLKIGMRMELAAIPFARATGDAPLTYAFRPAA
ncbi:MAG TPA: OB-fold domain-containing protein [Rhizomicrobium sp.]